MNTCFEIGEAVIAQPVDDQLVILNMANQQYFGLDEVGTQIWRLLIRHANLEEIVEQIHKEYEVDSERARADVENLVEGLMAAGLLKPGTV
jgi:hypothetical protein